MSQASIRIAEWTRAGPSGHPPLRGLVLSPAARELAAACERAGAVRVRELRQGVEIETKSFVGSIELDGVRIDVVPKIGLPRLMRMVARSHGLGELTLLGSQLPQGVTQAGFVDLLGHAVLMETRRLARRGLLQDYVMQEERLSTPRGRIDLRAAACGPPSATVQCRFEAFTPDHALHQAVKAGLHLASRLVSGRLLRHDLGRTAERFFPDVGTHRITRTGLKAAIAGLTRRTHGYRLVLGLIDILLAGLGVETEAESGRVRVPAFLLDMNRVFERFIERDLTRRMNPPFRVASQSRDLEAFRWQSNPRGRRAPVIRPDLVLFQGGRTMAVADAKYKDYDRQAVSTSDLFQVTTYAYACGASEAVPALVLYPTLREEVVESGALYFAGLRGRMPARIQILGIPVSRILDDEGFDLWTALRSHLPGEVGSGGPR